MDETTGNRKAKGVKRENTAAGEIQKYDTVCSNVSVPISKL